MDTSHHKEPHKKTQNRATGTWPRAAFSKRNPTFVSHVILASTQNCTTHTLSIKSDKFRFRRDCFDCDSNLHGGTRSAKNMSVYNPEVPRCGRMQGAALWPAKAPTFSSKTTASRTHMYLGFATARFARATAPTPKQAGRCLPWGPEMGHKTG